MEGNFVLKNEMRGATAGELMFVTADGDKIYLAHNLILIPVAGSRGRVGPPKPR